MMSSVKANERYIPFKNYIIAIGIIVGIILLTWYGFAWYNVVKENKLSKSYLVSQKVISQEIKDLDEVKDVLSEPQSTYYIYISFTGSEEVYNMEKDIKELITKYKLTDQFYYLDVTKIKNDDDLLDRINDALQLDGKKVKSIPTIIYVKDGVVVDLIAREDSKIMTKGDFQKLLDANRIETE